MPHSYDVSSFPRKLCVEFRRHRVKKMPLMSPDVLYHHFKNALCWIPPYRVKNASHGPWRIIVSKNALRWIPLNRIKKMPLMGPWLIIIPRTLRVESRRYRVKKCLSRAHDLSSLQERCVLNSVAYRVKKMPPMGPWRIIMSKNALCWILSYKKDAPHGPMTFQERFVLNSAA